MRTVDLDENYINDIVQLWNKPLHKSFPMREELLSLNSLSDVNVCTRASKLIVNNQDCVIAFVFAKRWQENLPAKIDKSHGFIQVFLVDEDYRNQGIGSKLLSDVEVTLKELGINKLSLGSDLWHYFPGLPAEYPEVAGCFERRGYERAGKVQDLINSYPPARKLSIPKAKNAYYEFLQAKDKELFLQFFQPCFPDRWLYEALNYFEKGGTGREFVVLKKDGKLKGFAV